MELGIIGAGDFAQAFARQALKGGHTVKLSNSHGPESLRAVVNSLGSGAVAATKNEAAACEIVLLVVPWDKVPETLASLPKWKNQILIDGTNPFSRKGRKLHTCQYRELVHQPAGCGSGARRTGSEGLKQYARSGTGSGYRHW